MKYLILITFPINDHKNQVTDKNFKDKVAKGVVVIKFTSKCKKNLYQMIY